MKFVYVLIGLLSFAVAVSAELLPSEEAREKRIQRLVEITRAQPSDVGAWHDLAGFYREGRKWDEAIAAEGKAIAKHPKYAAAYYGRGLARFGKKEFAAARGDFTKAIDLWQARGGLEAFLTIEQATPEHVDSYRVRGMAWGEEGKPAEGIADLSTAIRLKKHDPKLHLDRAALREKAGQDAQAVADYRLSALLYMDMGNLPRAEATAANLDRLRATREAKEVRDRIEESKKN